MHARSYHPEGMSRHMQIEPRRVLRLLVYTLLAILLVGIFLSQSGCTSTPALSTYNDQAKIAYDSVTAARQSATALLRAGKITVQQDQKLQADLTKIDSLIPAAKTVDDLIALQKQATATVPKSP